MSQATIQISHNAVIRLLKERDPERYRYAGQASAWSDYSDALRERLITKAQYDAAREGYGRLWNYCGD